MTSLSKRAYNLSMTNNAPKTIKAPLSRLDKKVWTFVLGYFNDHGYSPTRQEIADALGLSHRNNVSWRIQAMVKKGWLQTKPPTVQRNIIDPAKMSK